MLRSPLQPVLRSPLGSVLGYGTRTLASQVRALFANGEQGAIYGTDFSTLFQDSAGTVPVTAVEQQVGLRLDTSKGLVLGPEKWNNALVATDGASSIVSEGVYRIFSAAGAYSAVSVLGSMTIGKTYRAEFNIDSISFLGGGITIEGGAAVFSQTVGEKSCIFTATGTNFGIKRVSSATDMQVSAVSVRELPGNHLVQTTATKRAYVSRRVNLLLATATLATQNVTTRAASHVLKFTGTGSITLSGTATGVYGAGTHTITCTAGTLTLTVSGAVNDAGLVLAIDSHLPYQWVNTDTDYDADPAKFPTYLRYDGVDDSYQSIGNIDFTGTDKMTVWAGITKLSDAATGVFLETSATTISNNGAIGWFMSGTGGQPHIQIRSKGTGESSVYRTDLAAPVSFIAAQSADIGLPSNTLFINGVQVASSSATQGTGNYGNYPLFVGARNNSSLFFNGRDYGLIIRGAQSSPHQLDVGNRYLKQQMRLP